MVTNNFNTNSYNSLADFFPKYSLTDSQSKASELLHSFIASDERIFILKGYAGTGKTFFINDNLKNEVMSIFKNLLNKEVVLAVKESETENAEVNFTEEQEFLKILYEQIAGEIISEKIIISEVRHHQYMEAYLFKEGSFHARIDFYYNSKGKITTLKPQPQSSNSGELLSKILELLK